MSLFYLKALLGKMEKDTLAGIQTPEKILHLSRNIYAFQIELVPLPYIR